MLGLFCVSSIVNPVIESYYVYALNLLHVVCSSEFLLFFLLYIEKKAAIFAEVAWPFLTVVLRTHSWRHKLKGGSVFCSDFGPYALNFQSWSRKRLFLQLCVIKDILLHCFTGSGIMFVSSWMDSMLDWRDLNPGYLALGELLYCLSQVSAFNLTFRYFKGLASEIYGSAKFTCYLRLKLPVVIFKPRTSSALHKMHWNCIVFSIILCLYISNIWMNNI